MSNPFPSEVRAGIYLVFYEAQEKIAEDVKHGVISKSAALWMFHRIRDVARLRDNDLAEMLIPHTVESPHCVPPDQRKVQKENGGLL